MFIFADSLSKKCCENVSLATVGWVTVLRHQTVTTRGPVGTDIIKCSIIKLTENFSYPRLN